MGPSLGSMPLTAVASVLVVVGVAGAANPELRHPCRSPCPKTRKRREGENYTRRREPLAPLLCSRALEPLPQAGALAALAGLAALATPSCALLLCRWRLRCRLRWLLWRPLLLAIPRALAAVEAAVKAPLRPLPLTISQLLLPLRQPALRPADRPLPLAACAGCCDGRCRLRCRLRWLL